MAHHARRAAARATLAAVRHVVQAIAAQAGHDSPVALRKSCHHTRRRRPRTFERARLWKRPIRGRQRRIRPRHYWAGCGRSWHLRQAGLRRLSALVLGVHRTAPAAERAVARFRAPVLDVQDPAVMSALEQKGFGLAAVLRTERRPRTSGPLTRAAAPTGRLPTPSAADVRALRQEMKQNGRTLHEVTDQNVGRIIDLRWLQSPLASFRLAGVVNRLDRRDFADLARRSRLRRGSPDLPARLSLHARRHAPTRRAAVQSQRRVRRRPQGTMPRAGTSPAPGCRRPTSPACGSRPSGCVAGPLDRARLTLKQIEVNAQVVRFPSGMETEFGGQAVYLMRIFDGAALRLRLRRCA